MYMLIAFSGIQTQYPHFEMPKLVSASMRTRQVPGAQSQRSTRMQVACCTCACADTYAARYVYTYIFTAIWVYLPVSKAMHLVDCRREGAEKLSGGNGCDEGFSPVNINVCICGVVEADDDRRCTQIQAWL